MKAHPMTEPTTAELKMARECAASIWEYDGSASIATDIRAGIYDHTQQVRSALAAIRATGERAAAFIDRCNREGPYNAIGAAQRLRAGQHLETTV